MTINKIDSRFVENKGNGKSIRDEIDQTNEQLAQKLSQGEVSVSDIDKNKGKFDQTYMTDEFLQQMAGDTPVNSVPADDSLTTEKFVDESVTHSKRTPLGETGYLIVGSTATIPDIDLTNKQLVIYPTSFIVNRKSLFSIEAQTTVPFEGGGTNQTLAFNIKSKTFKFAPTSMVNTLENFDIVLMTIAMDGDFNIKSLWSTFDCTVNGESRTQLSDVFTEENEEWVVE